MPVRLSLAYFLVSALWILGSDELVKLLRLDPVGSHLAQTVKGWFFVTITALLLYRILKWWQQEGLRAECALAESESRLRQMADTIREVFWLTDPDKQEVLFVSSAYERLWGRPCQQLYERPQGWLEAIVEEDRDRVRAALPSQIDGSYDLTYRIRTPEGLERWIHDRAFPVVDATGKVVRVAGLACDISRERMAGQALRESEERYRCLVDLSPEGVAIQAKGC